MVQPSFETIRRRYRPRKTRVLLIAESPPSSGGFFYCPRTIGKDHLFRETMKALDFWPIDRKMPAGVDKRPLLERFLSMGLYLMDSSAVPVDKMSYRSRKSAILSGLPRLVHDVQEVNPSGIVIVKSSIFTPVNEALSRAGLEDGILNEGPIPFPSHGSQKRYRSMLRKALVSADLSL